MDRDNHIYTHTWIMVDEDVTLSTREIDPRSALAPLPSKKQKSAASKSPISPERIFIRNVATGYVNP